MSANTFFKCSICGNIVEIFHVGGGQLTCCGKPMEMLSANTTEAATEKHIPIISKTETGFKVTVGETLHPMDEDHYIEWISVYFDDGKVGHKHLKPGDEPVAEFFMNKLPTKTEAYCNKHGLWATS